ncbi:unnamed protein product [Dimorphilus gyrociliatus]|uniref:Uncharacterized protein n=1 Tax=Dimorphilus gyrociliatus TaxID=2664684 RepID=A0A7I8WCA9_9ANNE|nr:unnamed protein product [Dimorphilus gyrociliatus]
MTGVAMLAYMHKSPSKMWAALLVVFSAAISSTYKVLYVRFSSPNSKSVGSVAFFLSGVGLCSLLSSWPIPLTLALTGVEPLNNPPYGLVAGTIALAVAATLFANIGSTLTYNVAVQAGLILSIGVAIILDAYYEQLDYRPMQIGAMVLIACSFIFDACINILFEYCNKVYCKDRIKKKQEKTESRNGLSYNR